MAGVTIPDLLRTRHPTLRGSVNAEVTCERERNRLTDWLLKTLE